MNTMQATDGGVSVAVLLDEATAALTAAGITSARLEAEVLLATAWELDRTALYLRARAGVPPWCARQFRTLLARRCTREPLQYIVGRQEFWSLDFTVTPDVLIPRQETELLVELALVATKSLQDVRAGGSPSLCDLGTGSGCVAVALARELPHAKVWALDVSSAALAVAGENIQRHGVADRVRLLQSDLFSAAGDRRFDVVVSNPPYVSSAELAGAQPELAWEPRGALDGGADGLAIIRRLLLDAHLSDGGWVFMEIGADQSAAVTGLARAAGFSDVSVRTDYAGLPRVLQARR